MTLLAEPAPALAAPPAAPRSAGAPAPLAPHVSDADKASDRKNMLLLVQLRWMAVGGQVFTIAAVHGGLAIPLPLGPMMAVVLGLAALNLASLAFLRGRAEVTREQILLALLLDMGALTAQLALSGGSTNPFTSLYLLQLTLGAILLDAWASWALIAVAGACYAALTVSYRPLALPSGSGLSMADLHTIGILVGFALNATLIVLFVTRISRNLRDRDAGIAALRQQAAEEDHIVRMGLLASGAAHELGTPLASLSVILGDWKRMPELAGQPEIAAEIDEMQAEVARCKAIVTGILLASGAVRGEAPRPTSVNAFLDEIATEWRSHRSPEALRFRNAFGEDLRIVSDPGLKQIVFNVLDNAHEVSPGNVEMLARRGNGALVIAIRDRGPGFAPEMIAQIGTPYASSKGRLGGGLGLFLTVNVVRKLGGSVAAENLSGGGAQVTLTLPLSTLAIRGPDDE